MGGYVTPLNGESPLDGVQPNITAFSMHTLIWLHHKVVSQFSQPFPQNISQ